MKLIVGFLVGFFLGNFFMGCNINVSKHVDMTEIKVPEAKKLPKEVQEQFDAHLLTTPVLETVIIRVVKKILETVLIASIIALVTDYPFQAILFYVSAILLVSYPTTRYLISREIRSRDKRPDPAVLPA